MSGGSKPSTPKDTPEQRDLARVAGEKWNYAQQNLAPLEDEYMRDVGQMTDDGRMAYVRGRASQGQMQGMSQMLEQGSEQLSQGGIDPSSGRATTAMSGLSMSAAAAGADTTARAQFEQENEQIRGLQNITAMGQGEATQAQNGLSGIASQSAADARSSAVETFNRKSANLQLLGTAAGMGATYGLGGGEGPALGGTAAPDYQAGTGLNLYGS
ncbi:hypothetical protein [Salinicola halophilus]|uniref:hypothetical protein n=1 Tax=Salinicola halophilus TaxID=184065 RepID=UPI000DA221A7|nr:hypothetical protein [Salinicola halophilus]